MPCPCAYIDIRSARQCTYPSSALERRTQLAITGPMIHGPPYCPYSPTHTCGQRWPSHSSCGGGGGGAGAGAGGGRSSNRGRTHVLLGVCDLGERRRLDAVARAEQRVEVGLGGAPLLAKLVDGRGECAAARAEGVAKLAICLSLDELRALALRVLVHLEDGEVPGNAVVTAVDDDAGARLLRGRVVLRNHRPKEVGLSRDCREGTTPSIADVHATHWGSGPGVRTVCVVHALLGAQLDQRLSVFLKGAGGGDHHLFGRVAAAARDLAVLRACAKEVGTFVFCTTDRSFEISSAVVQTRSATSTGGC